MSTVFVVTIKDYYADIPSPEDKEVIGVAATMAAGMAMAEKRLQSSSPYIRPWLEIEPGRHAYTGDNIHTTRDMQVVRVRAYDVVGSSDERRSV